LEVGPLALQDAPFTIPTSWAWTRLGSVGDWGSGSTPPREDLDLYGGGMTWLKSGELNDNRQLAGSEETVSDLALAKGTFRRNRAGDVLVAMYGATIGKVAILAEEAVTNQAVCGCTPFDGVFNHFLFFYLLSQRRQFHSASEGGAQPNISKWKIIHTPFPFPPINEQHRIVARVDELMALCDRLEAQQEERETRQSELARASVACFVDAPTSANLNFLFHKSYSIAPVDLRKSILTLAVEGRLVLQDPEDEAVSELLTRRLTAKQLSGTQGNVRSENLLEPIVPGKAASEIPPSWAWCKMDQLVNSLRNDIRTGPFGSALHKHDHRADGVPVWGIESIGKGGYFTWRNKISVDLEKAQELATFSVKPGDIIISRSGTVGELCRIPDAAPAGLMSTNLMKISLDDQVITPDYFCLLFRGATSINTQLSTLCFGSTRLFLTQRILTKLLFPVPPLAEQRRIIAKANQLMALVDELERHISASREIGANLLNAVVAQLVA